MSDLTDAEIAEALRLCEAATPGPWIATDNGFKSFEVRSARRKRPIVAWPGFDESAVPQRTHRANTEFIAAARTGWPRALAERMPSAPCPGDKRSFGAGLPEHTPSCPCRGSGRIWPPKEMHLEDLLAYCDWAPEIAVLCAIRASGAITPAEILLAAKRALLEALGPVPAAAPHR